MQWTLEAEIDEALAVMPSLAACCERTGMACHSHQLYIPHFTGVPFRGYVDRYSLLDQALHGRIAVSP
jgi:hypothetical protein